MICRICGAPATKIFEAKIMDKYLVSYLHCSFCGFLQTEEPYWLNEAFEHAISLWDTGILSRNYYAAKLTAVIIFFLFNSKAKFLDYGGGYGVLTRLMRDMGFDFYWYDLYASNLFARGFEYVSGPDNIELVTSFESFEHFVNPLDEIEKILAVSKNVFFSTELLPPKIPQPHDWWYYGLDHGQHLSFYSSRTLAYIAMKYNLNFYSNGTNIHLYSATPINNRLFNSLLYFVNYGPFFVVKKLMKSKSLGDVSYLNSKHHTRK